MKSIILLASAAVLFGVSCTRTHPMGGGDFTECACHTDTTRAWYSLSSTYTASDSLLYSDSCNTLRAAHGWDTCTVTIEAL